MLLFVKRGDNAWWKCSFCEGEEHVLLRADFAYRVSSYSTGFYSQLRASMSYSLYVESLPEYVKAKLTRTRVRLDSRLRT
jgi:hypothetical protein